MRRKSIVAIIILIVSLFSVCTITAYAKDVKRLYFEEKNGEMDWNKIRGDNDNWFMSFINMVPGESYSDQLDIKNGSKKTYELFMQIIPLEQSNIQDALLKRIEMKISQDGEEIYKGNATGEPGTKDFQNIIPIDIYKPEKESQIQVDLKLDESIGIEYCDVLTKIDWKFMVREITEDKEEPPIMEIKPPKTGDSSGVELMLYLMIGAATVILLMNVFKQRNE